MSSTDSSAGSVGRVDFGPSDQGTGTARRLPFPGLGSSGRVAARATALSALLALLALLALGTALLGCRGSGEHQPATASLDPQVAPGSRSGTGNGGQSQGHMETTNAKPAAPAAGQSTSREQAELEILIGRLYRAFGFDAGGEPDWSVQRELFHPDCRFLGPVSPGREPRSEDLEQFLEGFAQFARGPQRGSTGLHERILDVQLWSYEGIAQARVLFEGHLPGELNAVTRGVDALQLVRTPSGWRIVGFAAQYERSSLTPQSLDGLRWASD